jgi:hypothetical protein
MTNPDTSAVIVINDSSSALIGGRQKVRPNKKRENNLVILMRISNKEASVEELVFDREYIVCPSTPSCIILTTLRCNVIVCGMVHQQRALNGHYACFLLYSRQYPHEKYWRLTPNDNGRYVP